MHYCMHFEFHFTSSLKQQYSITDVRYDILRLFAMAKAGCWEEIRQLYAQRKNIIPIEVGKMDGHLPLVLLASGSFTKSIQ